LFTIKGNLVIMHNLYRKVAGASVGIALGFALGARKEAEAAMITLTPATSFSVSDSRPRDGLGTAGRIVSSGESLYIAEPYEVRGFYEFNITNLSLTSNTVISSAIFQVRVKAVQRFQSRASMGISGYRGNGQFDLSDYDTRGSSVIPKVQLAQEDLGLEFPYDERFNFDIRPSVTSFVNELISTNNAFAGFMIQLNYGQADLDPDASLIITTVDVAEPVPEPTTIFGSAIFLGVGGWFKRKKSNPQNKAKSQA
jgi:hypothetical protein